MVNSWVRVFPPLNLLRVPAGYELRTICHWYVIDSVGFCTNFSVADWCIVHHVTRTLYWNFVRKQVYRVATNLQRLLYEYARYSQPGWNSRATNIRKPRCYGLGTRNVGEAETASLWPSHWLTSKERGQGGRFIGMVVISEEFISLCTWLAASRFPRSAAGRVCWFAVSLCVVVQQSLFRLEISPTRFAFVLNQASIDSKAQSLAVYLV